MAKSKKKARMILAAVIIVLAAVIAFMIWKSSIQYVKIDACVMETGYSLLVNRRDRGEFSYVSLKDVTILDSNGKEANISIIKPGQIINIRYSGFELTSYPSQLEEIYTVKVVRELDAEWFEEGAALWEQRQREAQEMVERAHQ